MRRASGAPPLGPKGLSRITSTSWPALAACCRPPVQTLVDDPVARPELILKHSCPALRAREADQIL